jgi:hypothetical protein
MVPPLAALKPANAMLQPSADSEMPPCGALPLEVAPFSVAVVVPVLGAATLCTR